MDFSTQILKTSLFQNKYFLSLIVDLTFPTKCYRTIEQRSWDVIFEDFVFFFKVKVQTILEHQYFLVTNEQQIS